MRGLAVAMAVLAACATAAEADCTRRLDRTLTHMQERPLLKEEHATALMWLRMDAAKDDVSDDDEVCLEKVLLIEHLLGLTSNPDDVLPAETPDASGKIFEKP